MREGHASVAPQPAEFSQLQGHAKEKFTKQLLFGWPGSLESLEEEETGVLSCLRLIVSPFIKVKRVFNAIVSPPQAFY